MPKYKLMIGRFPYGNKEDSRCVDWLIRAACKLHADRRFELCLAKISDTPITMTRNMMIQHAMEEEVDLLLFIDNDVEPDCELGEDPDAKPFLDTTLEFMLNHAGPCIVAAPYCGPPPVENVYVFQWGTKMSEDPDANGSLDQFTREQASVMTGITRVAALPTGLMLIDMRAFKGIKPPFTYYEWKGDGPPCPHCGVRKPGPQSEKGSTEDVTLTRDLDIAGVKQYCNWDAWAAHIKEKRVRKPRPWTSDVVADRMKEAVLRGVQSTEKLRDFGARPTNRFEADIAAAMARGPATVSREKAVEMPRAVEQNGLTLVDKPVTPPSPAGPLAEMVKQVTERLATSVPDDVDASFVAAPETEPGPPPEPAQVVPAGQPLSLAELMGLQ